MLRIKLFKGFVAVVLLFSVLTGFFAVNTLRRSTLAEAQSRVRLDLTSARSVLDYRLKTIETVLRLVAGMAVVERACADANWTDEFLRLHLERTRVDFGLDYLGLADPTGKTVLRTTPPYRVGDRRNSNPALAAAIKGEAKTCVVLLAATELKQESDTLAERAYLEIEATPHARKRGDEVETRGMALESAVPVRIGTGIGGIVFGGVLANRNHALIDEIHDVVYHNEKYKGRPLGTATLFLQDTRIATTVRLPNGNRALGTRVSKAVADRVLDNGEPWIGDAFVVRDHYLSAYEPLRDGFGHIVGMLYVGILRLPFMDQARGMAVRYALLSLLALGAALVIAFLMANRMADPIHRLVGASRRMTEGAPPPPVDARGACHETAALVHAFNRMTAALAEREEKLKTLNRSYMETLGFVSHELKGAVAGIVNYAYLLRQKMLGPLTDRQEKAVRAIDASGNRITEMVRHYLNLSRIENGELNPSPVTVAVAEEVITPLLDQVGNELAARAMRIENSIGPEVTVRADLNLTREVFENLVGNAIKYGDDGALIKLTAVARDGRWVEFSVWNEGPGIPADQQDKLFQKFSRISGGKAARQKGTGLGLFICKAIVTAHGGTLRAASRPGEWAEFVFTLPSAGEEKTA